MKGFVWQFTDQVYVHVLAQAIRSIRYDDIGYLSACFLTQARYSDFFPTNMKCASA